ncbi:DUF7261 family protein [Halorientalis marina]|uniref:DUF7261 family protein n=1 Tax=Halorientalis marina TaxID=2931976 RepID=UPI001FF5FF6B|nr:hypothetical protein [Halorientalis marina]
MVTGSRDRGQLLLVGGIVLGIVILGTVVLLNGMQFNDTIGSQGNQQALQNAERTQEMVRQDLQRMASRVAAGTDVTDSGKLESAYRSNVSTYAQLYSNMTFEDGIVFVNATFNESASENGRLLEQTSTDTFQLADPTVANDWIVGNEMMILAPMEFTVDDFPDNNGANRPNTTIRVTGSDGNVWELRINRSETDPIDGPAFIAIVNGEQRAVESVDPGASVNLGTGELEADPGSGTTTVPAFEFNEYVSRPYTVEIDNEQNGLGAGKLPKGTYRIGTDSRYLDTQSGGGVQPEITNPVLRPAVDLTYRRPELDYRTTIYLNATGGGS